MAKGTNIWNVKVKHFYRDREGKTHREIVPTTLIITTPLGIPDILAAHRKAMKFLRTKAGRRDYAGAIIYDITHGGWVDA